jgi:hypothetical protein
MWEARNAYRILWGNVLRNVHLEDQEGNRRKILSWIFGK